MRTNRPGNRSTIRTTGRTGRTDRTDRTGRSSAPDGRTSAAGLAIGGTAPSLASTRFLGRRAAAWPPGPAGAWPPPRSRRTGAVGSGPTGRTLLGVWAHPDDEAFLSAGLMAAHCRRGDRVVVVTATAGEHGTDDPAACPPDRLAACRRAELRASLAALGVDELHELGYEDGTCEDQDAGVATARIAGVVDDVRPDLIVTFGPDGVSGHPDHVAVHRWATAAWARTRPTAELWYPTFTPEFHRSWGAHNDRIGLWFAQPEPPSTAREDLAWGDRLPDDLADLKLAALEAHRSQTGAAIDEVGRATYREWWRHESFRRANVVSLPTRAAAVPAPAGAVGAGVAA